MSRQRKFSLHAVEQDFPILFGKDARWVWPFLEGDLFSSILNLGITTFIVGIVINIFVNIHFEGPAFVALAVFVFAWECARLNYRFIEQQNLRKRLRAKYLPFIEHTEAFELLMDAIASRRRGILKGSDSKEASNELLLKLWKACFAEAELLQTPHSSTMVEGDILDQRSPAEQIASYLEGRKQAHVELES